MSPARAAGRTAVQEVRLEIARISVRLTFGPGLEEVAAEVATLWEHLRVADGAQAARIELDYVLAGSELPTGSTGLRAQPSASYIVSGHITREVIRSFVGSRLLLHAASVVHPELGTVVMVGASGAGKSTAASELGLRGAYLTDELTILDPATFTPTPYPKPVSRHDPALRAKRDRALSELGLHPPADAGDHAVPGATAPSMVVLLHRIQDGEGSARPSVSRVPLPEALVRIVPQTSSLGRLPGGLAALATLLETTGGAVEARYREASELEGLLRSVPPAPSGEIVEIEGQDAPGTIEDGRVVVAPFRQALAIETGVFVLGRREGVHLSGLPALVWDLLQVSGPLTLDELEELLVLEIGEHSESAALLRSSLAELERHGWARQG